MHLFFYSSGFVIIILDLKRCLGIIQVDADSGLLQGLLNARVNCGVFCSAGTFLFISRFCENYECFMWTLKKQFVNWYTLFLLV
jgi:hypothetical protein